MRDWAGLRLKKEQDAFQELFDRPALWAFTVVAGALGVDVAIKACGQDPCPPEVLVALKSGGWAPHHLPRRDTMDCLILGIRATVALRRKEASVFSVAKKLKVPMDQIHTALRVLETFVEVKLPAGARNQVRADEILVSMKEYDGLDAAEFPDEQNPGLIVLLASNKTLQRLVACWPSISLPRDLNPRQRAPEELPEPMLNRWLWSRIDPDPILSWLQLAGLPDLPQFRKWADVAIDNKLVFPDGTVSKWTRQFLASAARDLLAQ